LFTNESLTVTNVFIYYGHYISRGISEKNEVLGFQNRYGFPDFWDRVGAVIKGTAGFSYGEIEELILYGEAAEEKRFLDEVRKALGDLQSRDLLKGRGADLYAPLQVSDFSALYIGARGAAEFARRWQGVSGDCSDNAWAEEAETRFDGISDPLVQEQMERVQESSSVYHASLQVVAWGIKKSDGRQTSIVRDQVVTDIGLDSRAFEEAKIYAQTIAEDKGWRIEIVDISDEECELWIVIDEVRQCVLFVNAASEVVVKGSNDITTQMTVLTWSDGRIVNNSTLLELKIDSERLDKIRGRAEEVAAGKVWWIEFVERAFRGREYWTVVDGSLAFIHSEGCGYTDCPIRDHSAELR
jgi:hypothetical protein